MNIKVIKKYLWKKAETENRGKKNTKHGFRDKEPKIIELVRAGDKNSKGNEILCWEMLANYREDVLKKQCKTTNQQHPHKYLIIWQNYDCCVHSILCVYTWI